MSNNSGLIRSFKKLNKNINSKTDNAEKKDKTLSISVLALIISIASIYFQFFFKSHDLKASLVDAEISNDSIKLNLIYQNRGNQDATIIGTHVFFYSDKTENLPKYHIEFINKENDKLPPFILSSGKQIFHNFTQKVYFDEDKLLSKNKIKNHDTLNVLLRINYINGNSLQAESITKCGWITLDKANKINQWSIDYQNINLDYDSYFSRGYSRDAKK